MENNRNSNTILLIVLIVLVLALAGYIAYDRFIKEDKCPEVQVCENDSIKEKGISSRGINFSLNTTVYMTAGTEAEIVADGKKIKMTLKEYSDEEDEEDDYTGDVYYSQGLSSKAENIILLCNCGGCSSIYVLTEDKTLYGVDEFFHQDFSLLSNMKKYDIKDINSIGSMPYEYDPEDTCGGKDLYVEKTDGTIYSLDSLLNNK